MSYSEVFTVNEFDRCAGDSINHQLDKLASLHLLSLDVDIEQSVKVSDLIACTETSIANQLLARRDMARTIQHQYDPLPDNQMSDTARCSSADSTASASRPLEVEPNDTADLLEQSAA